jgi:hypothetical protein
MNRTMHCQCNPNSFFQVRFAGTFTPGFVAIFLIPTDGCFSLADAFFEPHCINDFRCGFTTFTPDGAEGMQLAGMHSILQTEFKRVQTKVPGDFFHVSFDCPEALRNAITPEGACGSMVGVDDIGIKTDIGRLAIRSIPHVQSHGFVPGVTGNGKRMASIRPCICDDFHFIGCDRAIFFDPGLHMDEHWVA